MGIFSSFFGRKPDLGSADGTRAAMRSSYYQHSVIARRGELPLPPDTSQHEAAMYGALASRYVASGTSPEVVARIEPFLWLELLPFLYLPVGVGVEALVEYIVWKEPETTAAANRKWLVKRVHKGTVNAINAGRADEVKRAMSIGSTGQGRSPWVELVADQLPV